MKSYALWASTAVLAACSSTTHTPPAPPAPTETAPQAQACPKGLPEGTRCLGGRDSAGAHYMVAVPAQWNQTLVVHAHGGPLLGEPRPERVAEDLHRWSAAPRHRACRP